MISNNIKKETRSLRDRGLNDKSFFHATFTDGSEAKEHDCNWSDFSVEKRVKYHDGTKTVRVSARPVKNLKVSHEGFNLDVDVPENCEVYQCIRAESTFTPNGAPKQRIVGRVVGIIKNDEVVEERFINSLQNVILGFRK